MFNVFYKCSKIHQIQHLLHRLLTPSSLIYTSIQCIARSIQYNRVAIAFDSMNILILILTRITFST